MSSLEAVRAAFPRPVRSACPECSGVLSVLKIIPGRNGRGGCEYWTMRCTRCGGIHLDIVEPASGAAQA
jgi:uncharacterized Zn finger protein